MGVVQTWSSTELYIGTIIVSYLRKWLPIIRKKIN
jgi:hypothetical protein